MNQYYFKIDKEKRYIYFLNDLLSNQTIMKIMNDVLIKSFHEKCTNPDFQMIPQNIILSYLKHSKKSNKSLQRLQIIFNHYVSFIESNQYITSILDNKDIEDIDSNIIQFKNKNLYENKYMFQNILCNYEEYLYSIIINRYITEYKNIYNEKIKNHHILICVYGDKESKKISQYISLFKIPKKYIQIINLQTYDLKFLESKSFQTIFFIYSLYKVKNFQFILHDISKLLSKNGLFIISGYDIFTIEDYDTAYMIEKYNYNYTDYINPLSLFDIQFILKDLNMKYYMSHPLNNFLQQDPNMILQYNSIFIKE
jgi:hypothetical protein